MERTWSLAIWSSLFLSVVLALFRWLNERNEAKNRPPGPPRWPVFGNMFDLGSNPHQAMYKLKAKYGPLLWLRLGYRNTLVVQSPEAAEELFKNHDSAFCDRSVPCSFTAHGYHEGSIALGQYGPNWRLLRRLTSTDLMGNKRTNETALIRQKCVDDMIEYITKDVSAARERGVSGEVTLAHYLFIMTFNVIGNLTLSQDLLNSQSRDGYEFYDAMNKVMKWAGCANIADFLPLLKPLDPQGLKRNMVRDLGRAMAIVKRFIKERVEQKSGGGEAKNDFLDVLLDYEGEGPDKISDHNILVIILEMFFGGSETTSSAIEWAMTELLRKPEMMRKAQEELRRVIGPDRRVEESDVDDLPYLQAVIKETLRLHPSIPMLLPRNTREDVNFMGYHIPKDTQVFVNAWAIGRDPKHWEDPLSFKPERFLGSNVEYKGHDFEFLPFGSGRRVCVGFFLAHRVIHIGLASLLHSFDWELDGNFPAGNLDLEERVGLTTRKLVSLKAIPKRR